MNIRYFIIVSLVLAGVFSDSNAQTLPVQLPYNRMIQPAGRQIIFGDESLENHSLDAVLSPDGKWLAVEERYSIVFISTSDNTVKFILANKILPELRGGMNTYSGIIWHNGKKGPEVLWSCTGRNNSSYVASAEWDGDRAAFGRLIGYKAVPPAKLALPNEILITKESDKEFIYVVLNGNNNLIKQDFITGDTIWVAPTGVAPYGLTMASGKIYVTNWAGRVPDVNDTEVAGVPWGLARVDNNTGGGTREGSISVVDPKSGKITKEILAGLHPNEITSDKSGRSSLCHKFKQRQYFRDKHSE